MDVYYSDMANDTANAENNSLYEDNYYFDYGDEYMYPGYQFERPVYLYIWEILVIVTFIQNILILSVLMHKKMRNPTNTILSGIAIFDSLTGLVTLPTYIMVFQRYDPLLISDNQSGEIYFESNGILSNNMYPNNVTLNQLNYDNRNFSYYIGSILNASETLPPTVYLSATQSPVDGYTLSKNLCRGFMISKFFLSKSFHTISVFLILFLEMQRYVSMAYPYRYETCFNTFRTVNIYCVSAFVLCPFLHAYHFGSEKAIGGMCQWELHGNGCGKDCIYLWIAFVVRHFIPCVTLVIFTLLFIHQLRKGEKSFQRMDSNPSQYSRRVHENRRITLIVTAVVVVRLIPEIAYSIFLLYNSIDATVYSGKDIELEINRIFHMCYEICLICSFLANFYIYLIFNKSFRKRLYRTFIEPVRKQVRVLFRLHDFQSSKTRRSTMKFAESVKTGEDIEMKIVHSEFSDKFVKIGTKLRE
ncbi:uncharacterized protein LOC123527286 [Mercenaria mercenaria]|uniref:uncharacterized protein LOC123527286 n=1 Tax=Mercenaria mercenaria TaxID=6596 RepID=UPI00234ED85B|nr:uncharacterized protein LOC123527286 [Mercenaria mercenaria]XP_045162584.2 uncharacterized protein LOC123527286 [Mercenaria mercenaria]XP_045162585.2 uncharacterized protein LOC123527286 [Mercenaria mercenaria]XP_045162586.2 uncharacterized protein LOC123527286 [Mercenaria mercenaria]XP_045162587.2 uncharacterized protein LOC123527286 [Mercenaria mercenaria]XP_053379248.1 uncharacterized protein LOC123527286 [Mercenaria mercenaria]